MKYDLTKAQYVLDTIRDSTFVAPHGTNKLRQGSAALTRLPRTFKKFQELAQKDPGRLLLDNKRIAIFNFKELLDATLAFSGYNAKLSAFEEVRARRIEIYLLRAMQIASQSYDDNENIVKYHRLHTSHEADVVNYLKSQEIDYDCYMPKESEVDTLKTGKQGIIILFKSYNPLEDETFTNRLLRNYFESKCLTRKGTSGITASGLVSIFDSRNFPTELLSQYQTILIETENVTETTQIFSMAMKQKWQDLCDESIENDSEDDEEISDANFLEAVRYASATCDALKLN